MSSRIVSVANAWYEKVMSTMVYIGFCRLNTASTSYERGRYPSIRNGDSGRFPKCALKSRTRVLRSSDENRNGSTRADPYSAATMEIHRSGVSMSSSSKGNRWCACWAVRPSFNRLDNTSPTEWCVQVRGSRRQEIPVPDSYRPEYLTGYSSGSMRASKKTA